MWAGFLALEFVVLGVTCSGLFAGSWELVLARKTVGPIALAMIAPLAPLCVLLERLASRSGGSAFARAALALVFGIAAGLTGIGVTTGRHFASFALRAAFVLLLAGMTFVLVHALAPRVSRLLEAPKGARILVADGLFGVVVLWWADGHVLPRLYPAFHAALFGLLVLNAAMCALAWPRHRGEERVPPSEMALASLGPVLAVVSMLLSPSLARRLERADNLRLILDERAPVLGRAVHVAAWLAPPLPLDDSALPPPVTDVARSLDWSNEDILLVSVDALRADHLGSYGYGRKTTPVLDALAREGALFEHAYCPTPHTSYSVTSMMTGKAMRPLLSQGLGKESETWASYLRRYGYKTAAFYPPAVFYIDQERFTDFETTSLGFEYRWVEFTSAIEKVREVEKYLSTATRDPLFLWVHLFEPHEPYAPHAGYDFGGEAKLPVDNYDSEVAYSDAAIGELLRVVRKARPSVTVIVTADHGEEFGEHGGRYHGTTCYEEQVHVPLIIVGPGVVPRRIASVAQTIDLLPTVLSALGIPRPARVRGRDLGPLLVHARGSDEDGGLAYAETEGETLLASGDDRLICARKIGACALYDVRSDPGELRDLAPSRPAVAKKLRALTLGVERAAGQYESADVEWPEALRRGLQGEADAAEDVAALLDDANLVIRRKAAEVSFRLGAKTQAGALRRAFERDEDVDVKRWAALALVKMGEPPSPAAMALVNDPDVGWRRTAALAFAEAGDGRGKKELTAWWRDAGPGAGMDTAEANELLSAIAKVHDAEAVPALISSLDYVPLRPHIAEVLGQLGDVRARAPLEALFAHERYETARPAEASALEALGGAKEMLPSLTLYAGLPDPMIEAVEIAHRAGLLDAAHGGASIAPPRPDVDEEVASPRGDLRVWVLAVDPKDKVTVTVDGAPPVVARGMGTAFFAGVTRNDGTPPRAHVKAHADHGIRAVWLVSTSTP